MMQFKGFKPEAMKKIQGSLGYQGYPEDFKTYLDQNPDKKSAMDNFQKKAIKMMNGGVVLGYAHGGAASDHTTTEQLTDNSADTQARDDASGATYTYGTDEEGEPVYTATQSIGQEMVNQAYNPTLPYGGKVDAYGTVAGDNTIIDARDDLASVTADVEERDTANVAKDVGKRPRLSKMEWISDLMRTKGMTRQTAMLEANKTYGQNSWGEYIDDYEKTVDPRDTDTYDATQAADDAKEVSDKVKGRQGEITEGSTVGKVEDETTLVDGINAAQGKAVKVNAPMQREIEAGELISGSADAVKAAKFTEQIQAAEATPSKQATVAGQLEGLMSQFDDGKRPPWAAGALRAAEQQMLARGMGASSMAGQAIIQAAMESALPIAQMDASTQSTFEQANLSNRQQRAMQMGEQRAKFMGQEFDQDFQARVQNSARIGDIANMNFTAEQSIALENSRAANTMELSNLSNRQGKVMAQASALSNLELANLSNAQQAAVQNAQNFLAMDMQNMTNLQSADVFRAQQRQQALFTDAASDNAAKQFNSTSKNQTSQFVASLQSNTDQFNATQKNAMDAQNQNDTNAMTQFKADIENQRDQFTAANQLVVDQNNAVWRREIATADTVAINRANELNAAATLDMSKTAFNNLWNYYGDTMEWAWTSAENQQERWNKLAQQQMINDTSITVASLENDYQSSVGFGGIIGKFLTAGMFGF